MKFIKENSLFIMVFLCTILTITLNITYSKFVMLACEFALERFDKESVPESMKYKDKPKKRNKTTNNN